MALDKLIHEQSRLQILTYLTAKGDEEISFTELQDKFSFSSGNLSVQLKKLSEAGYVTIEKTFKDNKPYTTAAITQKGRDALETYIQEMDDILMSFKKG